MYVLPCIRISSFICEKVDESTIFGDNVTRYNDAETERIVKDDASDTLSNDALEGCTKLLIRKSVIGPRCRLEYQATGSLISFLWHY